MIPITKRCFLTKRIIFEVLHAGPLHCSTYSTEHEYGNVDLFHYILNTLRYFYFRHVQRTKGCISLLFTSALSECVLLYVYAHL